MPDTARCVEEVVADLLTAEFHSSSSERELAPEPQGAADEAADHDDADGEHDRPDDDAHEPPQHEGGEDAATDASTGEPDRERSSSTASTLRP